MKKLNLFTRIKNESYELIVINKSCLKLKEEKQMKKTHNFYQ